MRTIQITDTTMQRETSLSFREKIELCKLLDRLGVDVIETAQVTNRTEDGLLLKSLSSACLAGSGHLCLHRVPDSHFR